MFILGGVALIIAATAVQARAHVLGGLTLRFIVTGLTALVLTAGVAALVFMRGPAQPPQTARAVAALVCGSAVAVAVPLLASFLAMSGIAARGNRPYGALWFVGALAGVIVLLPALYGAFVTIVLIKDG